MGQTRRGAGMIQRCRQKGQTLICDPRDLVTLQQANGSDPEMSTQFQWAECLRSWHLIGDHDAKEIAYKLERRLEYSNSVVPKLPPIIFELLLVKR
jgi:hypothetical protein